MKHHIFSILLVYFLFQSCWLHTTDYEQDYTYYTPIHFSRTELNNLIKLSPAKNISNSGKIYIKNNLLFINEKLEGFHIFDNSDPTNPVKIKFLEVLGSTDLAIRDSILYINQATDLIALKFDPTEQTIQLTKRIENTFPELNSPYGNPANNIPEGNITINWTLKSTAQ